MHETITESPQTTPNSSIGVVQFSGESMQPALKSGQRLLVRYFLDGEKPEFMVGDLALLFDGTEYLIHRCVSHTPTLQFKGDHSLRRDRPIAILGKVLGVDQQETWGESSPPLAEFTARASRLFSHEVARPIRWGARLLLLTIWKGRELELFIRRRARQLLQILDNKNLRTTEGLIQSARNRYTTPQEVHFYSSIAFDGLEDIENEAVQIALQQLDQKNSALVVGCGAGRECFALSRHFHQVIGLDWSQQMTAAARSLGRSQKNCEFVAGELDDLDSRSQFDFIFSARGVLNHLPTQTKRIELLRSMSSRMTQVGRIVVQAHIKKPSPLSLAGLSFYLLKSIWKEAEAGDSLRSFLGTHNTEDQLLYYHLYPTEQNLMREIQSAGLFVTRKCPGAYILAKGLDPRIQ